MRVVVGECTGFAREAFINGVAINALSLIMKSMR